MWCQVRNTMKSGGLARRIEDVVRGKVDERPTTTDDRRCTYDERPTTTNDHRPLFTGDGRTTADREGWFSCGVVRGAHSRPACDRDDGFGGGVEAG
ncbi:MAG: hypothetical protein AVDCRST_MAG93-3777 [uncultured Chloroflexia bacterium]|uniref:Uncharacterized protein n=1 Tax=uncultured Chloroflexia bacterium TaxID=1672391 RepID=A0A6J4JWU0_9CHLR|nr:MAG: hypothetical protein AVDCRST_MAG93-3777 [uncultured Chloroflexia bacterium]